MELKELRSLSSDELSGKVASLREELFKVKLQVGASEKRDTTLAAKTRRNIARVLTVLAEKKRTVTQTGDKR